MRSGLRQGAASPLQGGRVSPSRGSAESFETPAYAAGLDTPQSDARILIVDDHRLFAEVILYLLEEMGLTEVEIETDGRHAIETARRMRPHLILVAVEPANQSGVDIGQTILEEVGQTSVLALTASSDARMSRKVIQAGFQGCITRDMRVSHFMSSIRAALEGGIVALHQLPHRRSTEDAPGEDGAAALARLTPRERQVLQLLAQGLDSSTIAGRLAISANTFRTHTQNMMTKLQVHSRLEAAAFAARQGMLTPAEEASPA